MSKFVLRKLTFNNLIYLIIFLFLFFFFSFRLTKIPPGINIDESAFGYNSSLISKSLHDENGRFLPIFFLTLDKRDWKPPIRIYATAILFKLFGTTYYNLRLVSVLIAVLSSFLFYKLLKIFFSEKLSLIGLFLFVTSPSLLLQTHLAFDNIDPLPFVLIWLIFLISYSEKPKSWKLLISGAFLGASFYTYKAMHAFLPVYIGTSLIFILYLIFTNKKENWKSLIYFLIGLFPFLAPLNYIQQYYSGAVYDPGIVKIPSFYDAMYIYFSSFDFSFLFVKGDLMLIHSTGHQGIFLIPTVILLFLGFLQLVKEKKPPFYLIFFSLIFTPVLLTTVDSVYRANRLMVYIPFFSFIFTLGIKNLLELKSKKIKYFSLIIIFLLITASYYDFVKYYWNTYPKTISQDFSPNFDLVMKKLYNLSKDKKNSAFVEEDLYRSHKADIQFFSEVYFPNNELKIWSREKEEFPLNSYVLTGIGGNSLIKTAEEVKSLESGQRTLYIVTKK